MAFGPVAVIVSVLRTGAQGTNSRQRNRGPCTPFRERTPQQGRTPHHGPETTQARHTPRPGQSRVHHESVADGTSL